MLLNLLYDIENVDQDSLILIDELEKELCNYQDEIKLVGDGAKICYNTLKEDNIIKASKLSFEQEGIKASNVGFVAIDLYKNGEFTSACDIRPTYLKVCQAERMLNRETREEVNYDNSNRSRSCGI